MPRIDSYHLPAPQHKPPSPESAFLQMHDLFSADFISDAGSNNHTTSNSLEAQYSVTCDPVRLTMEYDPGLEFYSNVEQMSSDPSDYADFDQPFERDTTTTFVDPQELYSLQWN